VEMETRKDKSISCGVISSMKILIFFMKILSFSVKISNFLCENLRFSLWKISMIFSMKNLNDYRYDFLNDS